MTANASTIFRSSQDETVMRLHRKLRALIRAVHILKAKNDEVFLDELLVQTDFLVEAYDDQLNSYTPETLREIFIKIDQIVEGIKAKERDYEIADMAKMYEKVSKLSDEIKMVSKWTFTVAQQKRSLAWE